jgi:hypothetical protein
MLLLYLIKITQRRRDGMPMTFGLLGTTTVRCGDRMIPLGADAGAVLALCC